MKIRTDINGKEVQIGDQVHCFDGHAGVESNEITASLIGIVSERGGVIYVGDNSLAISCAEHVEITCEQLAAKGVE